MSISRKPRNVSNRIPGDYSERVPPDPIPNSEVKTFCADDSVGFHAKVGHCQVLISSHLGQMFSAQVRSFGPFFFA